MIVTLELFDGPSFQDRTVHAVGIDKDVYWVREDAIKNKVEFYPLANIKMWTEEI